MGYVVAEAVAAEELDEVPVVEGSKTMLVATT